MNPYHCRLLPFVACALALGGCAGVARSRQPLPYESIRSAMAAGNLQEALAAFDQAAQGRVLAPADRLLRAQLLLALGRGEEAGAELEGVLALDPSQPAALAALGRLALEAGEVERARGLFEQAVRLEPGNFVARHGLGRLALAEERYAEAAAELDRALAVEQGFSYVYADRARARLALEDWAGAGADLDQAVRLDPEDPWTRVDRGRLRLRERRLEDARADFTLALELDPDNFLATILRAGINDEQGSTRLAISDYEQALRLQPKYTFAFAPLAVLYYIEGSWERAGILFQQAFRAEEREPGYALLAALCFKQLGRTARALEILNSLNAAQPAEGWPAAAARYLANPALELATLAAITKEPNQVARARLLFYLAAQFLLEGRVPPAITYLAETAAIERKDLPERRIAAALLKTYGIEDN